MPHKSENMEKMPVMDAFKKEMHDAHKLLTEGSNRERIFWWRYL
jgi:hypothetical protein